MLPPFLPIPFRDGAEFIDGDKNSCGVYSSSWPKAWGSSNELIVCVGEAIVCSVMKEGVKIQEVCIPIPEFFEALCVFLSEQYIFVGGKGGKIKIICVRIADFARMDVEHPNLLRKYRKSIDDFFVWNDRMYAIDNHIHPKYLLGYILEGEQWCCVDKRKLKGHAPEERVKGGLLWGDTLVLLSRSAHRAGSSTYLSMYPNLEFSHYLCWHKTLGSSGITDIYGMRVHKKNLLLVTNIGIAILRKKEGREEDVIVHYAQKNMIDVYPLDDQEWIGIVSKFGKIKKIMCTDT